MRPKPNRPRSSSRKAKGSVMAVPRSSAFPGPAQTGRAHISENATTRKRSRKLMLPLTPRKEAYSSKKALHIVVKRLCFSRDPVVSARHDQALAGDHHPAAILLANGIDAANAGMESPV